MKKMYIYPRYVNVKDKDGNITKVKYKDIKSHEEEIIKDNIVFGFYHSEYSTKEIIDYEREANKELKELQKQIRENPDVVLELDSNTGRYVLAR